ncbi:MAG TPA: hypothetical protein VGL93_10515 [Streptosporangiaceae bacterium]|jgi:hypothetical protein
MTCVYRNENTGDEVERAERSARLDHLPNWHLIGQSGSDEDAPNPEPSPEGEQGDHGQEDAPAELSDAAPVVDVEPDTATGDAEPVEETKPAPRRSNRSKSTKE